MCDFAGDRYATLEERDYLSPVLPQSDVPIEQSDARVGVLPGTLRYAGGTGENTDRTIKDIKS